MVSIFQKLISKNFENIKNELTRKTIISNKEIKTSA